MRRHTAIDGGHRFARRCMADFPGDLNVGNSVTPPHGGIKRPHSMRGDFLSDLRPVPFQRLAQRPNVSVFVVWLAVVREKPRGIGITPLLSFPVRFQPFSQSLVNADEGIDGFLIFGAAHTEGFSIGADPAWFIRLGIRS